MKRFSFNLIEDVVSFSDKTIKETNTKPDQTEVILQQHEDEYEEIEKIQIKWSINEKKILHERKFKKFNNLKYKPKA